MLHLNNRGGYMLLDARRNFVVDGSNYDLTLQDILDHCTDMDDSAG